ncbi:hypothetical protein PYW07_009613 [Mythimna separata]|uniref:Uncharacterized protein n=1 Tax=Mythimna separata TaxID=271217 RepID=A0AAD7YBU4_MYTSE|nr:hypothetical protein PYW07_009613 [Mythimna separata]
MISPLSMTPSSLLSPPEETRMADSYGPPPLIEFNTPPCSPSERERALNGYSPRFVSSLFRDAQANINNAEVTLSPHSKALFGPNIDIAMIALTNVGDNAVNEAQLNEVNVSALKLNDVDKLLSKHFGDNWKAEEQLSFYKNALETIPDVGGDEQNEDICEHLEEVSMSI